MRWVLFLWRSAVVTSLLLAQAHAGARDEVSRPNTPTSRKFALIIGVAQYSDPAVPELRFPTSDADAVAAVLAAQGFGVQTLTGRAATKEAIVRATESLGELAHPDDTVLFYYSGHGVQDESGTYIAPYDAIHDKISESFLSVKDLSSSLARAVRNTLVILDACQTGRTIAGPFHSGQTPAYTLYSTQPGEISYESEMLREGVFTHHLLRGLRGEAANDIGQITWHGLVQYVVRHVAADTWSRGVVQLPFANGPDLEDVELVSSASLRSQRKVLSSLPMATSIENRAMVVFDPPLALEIPSWINTLDNEHPTSRVNPLAPTQSAGAFSVSWSGNDSGVGVRDFSVYVSDNGAPFTRWLGDVSSSAEVFKGTTGHSYAFYSVARDLSGRVEGGKGAAETITRIVAQQEPPPLGPLGYSIMFESRAISSAPAQSITVTYALSPSVLDLAALAPISLGNGVIEIHRQNEEALSLVALADGRWTSHWEPNTDQGNRNSAIGIASVFGAAARVRPLTAYSQLERLEMMRVWDHAVRTKDPAALGFVCSAYPATIYCLMAQQESVTVRDELRPKGITPASPLEKEAENAKLPLGAILSIVSILVTINLWVLKLLLDSREKPKRLITLR